MGLLKKEPAGRIASAEELMAVAHALEREAAGRYRDLSHRMRLRGEEDLAELFAFLSRIEEKHADQVDERTRAIVGKPPDPARVRWELPEQFDEEGGRSYLLTPYRALAIAVRNEERAFAFYSYLAAGAEDDRIRRLAEEFAKDELDHAALLRRERRKAWRREGPVDPFVEPLEVPGSLPEFRAQAAGMERAMAQGHGALAAARAGGVPAERIALDPGLGFSKTPEQSVAVLRAVPALAGLGYPVMLGPSRKRFLGAVTGRALAERDVATAAACALGWMLGARLFRVHAPGPVRDALAVAAAVGGA